jgi:TatD DNase family protein
MQLIDTHAHLYAKEFDADRTELIRRCKASGIQAVLLPNEDSGSIDAIHALSDQEPEFAFPMMGLHPTSVDTHYIRELDIIESTLIKRKYYAIGEIGIDLYWDKRFLKEQKRVFEEQLQWSIDLQLPVAIHTRDSFDETLDCIHKVGADRLKGVFHCFGGTIEQWNEISSLSSFYVGIGGVVTYKNSLLTDTLKHIPVDRIVLETDAPYLTPIPYRGKRNEPSYLLETAKKVADCLLMATEAVAYLTFDNTMTLFHLPTCQTIESECIIR